MRKLTEETIKKINSTSILNELHGNRYTISEILNQIVENEKFFPTEKDDVDDPLPTLENIFTTIAYEMSMEGLLTRPKKGLKSSLQLIKNVVYLQSISSLHYKGNIAAVF